MTNPSPSHDALQEQATHYALTWARKQFGQIHTLELLPCCSPLFLAGDCAWIAQPTLASGDEAEPFLVAWRQGQFAALLLYDFVLSIAGHLEAAWRERGCLEATMLCDWHPPMEDVLLPELAQPSERDDAWAIEIATTLDAESPITSVYSLVWLHYADQTCEIRVIHTQTQPFVSPTEQERN